VSSISAVLVIGGHAADIEFTAGALMRPKDALVSKVSGLLPAGTPGFVI
jgi:hypothetical protein